MQRGAYVLILATLAAGPARAQEPGRVTVTAGMDVPTAYVFRGIMQEDQGLIVQPFVDLGVALGRLTVNAGSWNSPHTGPSGPWYEADFYGSIAMDAGVMQPSFLFTSYTSPADRFRTVHELAAVLAIDDGRSPWPIAPQLLVAVELAGGQADGGEARGAYFELGARPAVALPASVTMAIPLKVGLSLKDYYEGPAERNRFGYFSSGLMAGVPLRLGAGGEWEVHGGVEMLWLGENARSLNADRRFRPVALVGFTVTY